MARFAEIRKHARGQKRREAKEVAKACSSATVTVAVARRVPGAIKPTTQRARGRHLNSYEIDPFSCDLRELALYACEGLDDDDNLTVASEVQAA